MKKFVLGLALVCAVLSILPYLYGVAITPPGARYLGFQYNTDDHMVYAAWMRQAMDGHFLMDNRFAVDPQPGLTIHIYFLLLGLLAKVTGIGLAAALARFVLAGAFILLLYRLVRHVTAEPAKIKLALVLGVFAQGIGFLCWQPLGESFAGDSPFKSLLLGHLPNDVWQPEAFVFSSLLTNSLFSVSLCLITGVFLCVLSARDSWKPVPFGFTGFLLLMNIHSYDVLLVALVLVGLLVMSGVQKQITGAWIVRVLVMGLGAVPAALWFVHVLKLDPVFQSRAATLTFTENFRSIFFGYLPMFLLAGIGAFVVNRHNREPRHIIGTILFAVVLIGLFLGAASQPDGFWFSMGAWVGLYLLMLVILGLIANDRPGMNLIHSWACIGLVAPFFPALFQRKLMMGLSLPWAILAALGLAFAIERLKGNERRLVAALGVLVLSASSALWLIREFQFINANESRTGQQPVFLDQDESKIIDYLNANIQGRRTVVISLPPLFNPPVQLTAPILPDMNPILSGLTGAYTYAGHWSETPHAQERQREVSGFFQRMSAEQQSKFAKDIGLDYVVVPGKATLEAVAKIAPQVHFTTGATLGDVVVPGERFQLVKVRRTSIP